MVLRCIYLSAFFHAFHQSGWEYRLHVSACHYTLPSLSLSGKLYGHNTRSKISVFHHDHFSARDQKIYQNILGPLINYAYRTELLSIVETGKRNINAFGLGRYVYIDNPNDVWFLDRDIHFIEEIKGIKKVWGVDCKLKISNPYGRPRKEVWLVPMKYMKNPRLVSYGFYYIYSTSFDHVFKERKSAKIHFCNTVFANKRQILK